MRVGGIIDISTKDIPNKACMVIFTVGCNFNCGFCHNKYLLQPHVGKDIDVKNLIKHIKSNVLVSSVSISGGEPTLQKDLIEICKEIRSIAKYLNIDTNGSNPDLIHELIPYINRVSLDLKGPLNQERLEKITRVKVDSSLIYKTFKKINNSKEIDFEIRTTYVERLLTPDDINEILSFLVENKFRGEFVLQQYQFSEGVGENFKEKFQKPEHITLLNILKPYRNLELPFDIFLRDNIIGYQIIDNLYDYLDE